MVLRVYVPSDMRNELVAAATACDATAAEFDRDPLDSVIKKTGSAARSLGASWSQSWAGYQARCYWRDFAPAERRFDIEWGMTGRPYSSVRVASGWKEYSEETVFEEIRRRAGVEDPDLLAAAAEKARGVFAVNKREVLTTLDASLSARPDASLKELRDRVAALEDQQSAESIVHAFAPPQVVSRDPRFRYEGIKVPPHIQVQAEVMCHASCAGRLRDLAALAHEAALYLGKRRLERPWDLWVLGAFVVGGLAGKFGGDALHYAQRFALWATRGLPRAARVTGVTLVIAAALTLAALLVNLAAARIDREGEGVLRVTLRRR